MSVVSDPEALRCLEEIGKREQLIRSGAIPEEMEGILQGIQDWAAELRIIEGR